MHCIHSTTGFGYCQHELVPKAAKRKERRLQPYAAMTSLETGYPGHHRMLTDDARRLLYLSALHHHHSHPSPIVTGTRPDSLTVRRPLPDPPTHAQQPQSGRTNTSTPKRTPHHHHQGFPAAAPQPSSAVSRRNARERKRVRLVNLGFSTLRERVPPGAKNKKLSKVETLRAAIEYIRQLQRMLGMTSQDAAYDAGAAADENYALDDCSSVASSEEVAVVRDGSGGMSGGSADLSPASSHPSDYSLVSSPYTSQTPHDDHLIDIGLWFS